jgi:peptidylprolyl isomerase
MNNNEYKYKEERKMAKAKNNDTVKVHYTGKLDDGRVFDSSESHDPLQFTIGGGKIIPGFEQAVIGMNPGESKTIKISADQAYGPYHKDMVMVVERDKIPENIKPEIGQQLELRQAGGQSALVAVTGIAETSVTLDANHPLAGKDLIFDIQLVEIV